MAKLLVSVIIIIFLFLLQCFSVWQNAARNIGMAAVQGTSAHTFCLFRPQKDLEIPSVSLSCLASSVQSHQMATVGI